MRYPAWPCVVLVGALSLIPGAEGPTHAQKADGPPVAVSRDLNDWPMYNHDVLGTRFNSAEKALRPDNVAQLVEKWRFPPEGSKEKIGVVHAVVAVKGHVYFGTETLPAFYKLTPDGKVQWVYRDPDL